MADTRNALAELANELGGVFCEYMEDIPIVEKAQRIIAELAKVADDISNPWDDSRINAVTTCRAIAEEGDSYAQAT